MDDDGDDDGDVGTVFRDVITLALAGFVAIVLLILPWINPPTQKSDVEPPGSVIVEIRWADRIDTDVDLWVRAPNDIPVGYSQKSGRVFNLLRDDLGGDNDLGSLNYENAYTRGAPAGEYVINLHLYSDRAGAIPVMVMVRVSYRGSEAWKLYEGAHSLAHVGQEITCVRFALDDNGRLVSGSVHDLPMKLRPGGQG